MPDTKIPFRPEEVSEVLYVFGDGVSVCFTAKQGVQDQKVKSSLQELYARGRADAHSVDSLLYSV